jgi:hypothetical protein
MYTVKMLDRTTGEIRDIVYKDWEWSKGDHDDWFLWDSGNWSCDCNRELDWARDKGEEIPEDPPGPTYCKGSFRFFVLEIRTPDGKVVYGPEPQDGHK